MCRIIHVDLTPREKHSFDKKKEINSKWQAIKMSCIFHIYFRLLYLFLQSSFPLKAHAGSGETWEGASADPRGKWPESGQ